MYIDFENEADYFPLCAAKSLLPHLLNLCLVMSNTPHAAKAPFLDFKKINAAHNLRASEDDNLPRFVTHWFPKARRHLHTGAL